MKNALCAAIITACFLASCAWAGAEEKVFAPQDLPRTFTENPDGAKAQYMGKTVQIKGIVVNKGMSRYMTPYVEISESGKVPAPARCVLPYSGMAYWNRSAQLSDFEQGQTVTFSGRVHVIRENLVLLKESKVVE
ncbi:MAG: OB-fold putative lipoprotein [Synergistaceae bacterium]|nr:OB-fold putative lipoprotein [Synergistaceae bacterium]